MTKETNTEKKMLPVEEMSLVDAEFCLPEELLDHLRQMAERKGFDPRGVLYVGADLSYESLLERGYGSRKVTWAFTDAQFMEAVKGRAVGEHIEDSPLHFALTMPADQPAIVMLDGTKFDNLLGEDVPPADPDYQELGGQYSDLQYKLKEDQRFDDAVVGILFFAP